jgi:hypothetical protein
LTGPAVLRDASRLLTAWEEGGAVPSSAVGAVLLRSAGLVDDLDSCLDLPLGTTSALVARVYAESFGDTVDGVLTCGVCDERLEVTLSLDVFRITPEGPDRTTVVPREAGGAVVVRCPTTRDLLAVAAEPDPAVGLLARCVTSVDGAAVDPGSLDTGTMAAVDAAAEDLAGSAAVLLRSACPHCGSEVSADVDVPGLLWQRVAEAVPVVLAEVAELAASFGWSEADILAMTATRRNAYLGIARSWS